MASPPPSWWVGTSSLSHHPFQGAQFLIFDQKVKVSSFNAKGIFLCKVLQLAGIGQPPCPPPLVRLPVILPLQSYCLHLSLPFFFFALFCPRILYSILFILFLFYSAYSAYAEISTIGPGFIITMAQDKLRKGGFENLHNLCCRANYGFRCLLLLFFWLLWLLVRLNQHTHTSRKLSGLYFFVCFHLQSCHFGVQLQGQSIGVLEE